MLLVEKTAMHAKWLKFSPSFQKCNSKYLENPKCFMFK